MLDDLLERGANDVAFAGRRTGSQGEALDLRPLIRQRRDKANETKAENYQPEFPRPVEIQLVQFQFAVPISASIQTDCDNSIPKSEMFGSGRRVSNPAAPDRDSNKNGRAVRAAKKLSFWQGRRGSTSTARGHETTRLRRRSDSTGLGRDSSRPLIGLLRTQEHE